MKVLVKYNTQGERRFYEEGVLDERLTKKAGLQKGLKGSGVEGVRNILRGVGLEYEESAGVGYTQWVFDEKKISWGARVSVIKTLKIFRRVFKRDPDMNMVIR